MRLQFKSDASRSGKIHRKMERGAERGRRQRTESAETTVDGQVTAAQKRGERKKKVSERKEQELSAADSHPPLAIHLLLFLCLLLRCSELSPRSNSNAARLMLHLPPTPLYRDRRSLSCT